MAEMHRARACMVGSEEDMYALCRAMLRAYGEWEEDEEAPPMKLNELVDRIHQIASQESGEENGFLYEMVRPSPNGSAEAHTTRFTVSQQPSSLWTAVFAWDSQHSFQAEDWLHLHRRSGRVPMLVVYASHNFGLEKGSALITNERVLDNWDTMNEGWFWLIAQYECGYPPEEAVARLKKLAVTMELEDCGETIDELLENCEANLTDIAASVADPDTLRETMADAARKGNWGELMSCEIRVAEAAVWQTEHNHKWLAQLAAMSEAWAEAQ